MQGHVFPSRLGDCKGTLSGEDKASCWENLRDSYPEEPEPKKQVSTLLCPPIAVLSGSAAGIILWGEVLRKGAC